MVSLVAIAISLFPLTVICLLLWLSSAEERWLERSEQVSQRLEDEYQRNALVARAAAPLVRQPVPPAEEERAA